MHFAHLLLLNHYVPLSSLKECFFFFSYNDIHNEFVFVCFVFYFQCIELHLSCNILMIFA